MPGLLEHLHPTLHPGAVDPRGGSGLTEEYAQVHVVAYAEGVVDGAEGAAAFALDGAMTLVERLPHHHEAGERRLEPADTADDGAHARADLAGGWGAAGHHRSPGEAVVRRGVVETADQRE